MSTTAVRPPLGTSTRCTGTRCTSPFSALRRPERSVLMVADLSKGKINEVAKAKVQPKLKLKPKCQCRRSAG